MAPGDSVNHLDHIAPIAEIMKIPLLIEEEFLLETMKKYYPQIETIFVDHPAKLLNTIASQFEYLFVTGADYRPNLSPLLELIYQKEILFWYCNHGNSDKTLDHFKKQNFAFIYGPQMKRRLKEEGHFDQLEGFVQTGNFRLKFYQKYQLLYDQRVDEDVFSKFDKPRPTILYAPTWVDHEKNTSIFEVGLSIVDQLPNNYNLILKIHPWLAHHNPGFITHVEERFKNKNNVVVLSQHPLVFPLLNRVDIYLGDFSSIGYDFLIYNRPMFFFDPSKREKSRGTSTFLHQCGTLIPESAYTSIYPFIEDHLDSQEKLNELRKEIYFDAFGKEKEFEEINSEISAILNRKVIPNLHQ
jgi:hypothetical protein